MIGVLGFYYLTSVTGYLSTFDNTPPVVIDRVPLDESEIDYAQTIGRLGVYITLILSTPVVYSVLRASFFNIAFSPEQKIENPKFIISKSQI